MKGSRFFSLAVLLVLVYLVGYQLIWKWGVCRVYVNQGESLMVRYRGNLLWPSPPMAEGDFAKVDESGRPLEIGILKEMLGPGRHFIDPIHYEREIVDDIVILPGQVGVVTSKFGKDLPAGEFLVAGDVGNTEFKGILRKVLKPGRYRINRFGYEVSVEGTPERSTNDALASADDQEMADFRQRNRQSVLSRLSGKRANWVVIPPGYVGVVTNLANDPTRKIRAGIQEDVLQPGIYAVNPREQQIDIISIGYTGITIKADLEIDRDGRLKMDENGEPIVKKGGDPGINFPSNDGFPISLDFTGIWGIMPKQAARIVSLFGNLDAVETTVIIPEIESICRIHGSKLGAVDLLTGDSREMFQREVSEDFRKVLSEKNISLQVGLVRHIYIPPQVRGPIQKANIADEVKLTRDMEIETAKVEADLEEARASVTKDENKVTVETEKLYQEAMALGRKQVEELHAQTDKLVAAIAKETAEIESEAKLVLGEAEAKVETLRQEAEAQRFALAVDAFGSPEAYNQWVFATGLPDDLQLTLLYAGQGTFWTDLKGFQEAALGKVLETNAAKTTATEKPADVPARATPVRSGN